MLCACQVASVMSDSYLTPWTVAHQAPLSMGFSRQEYWSGLPFPSPGYLPDPGIELASLMSPVLAGRLFITSITWEAPILHLILAKRLRSDLHLFCAAAAAAAKLIQSCPTLCDPIDGSPSG